VLPWRRAGRLCCTLWIFSSDVGSVDDACLHCLLREVPMVLPCGCNCRHITTIASVLLRRCVPPPAQHRWQRTSLHCRLRRGRHTTRHNGWRRATPRYLGRLHKTTCAAHQALVWSRPQWSCSVRCQDSHLIDDSDNSATRRRKSLTKRVLKKRDSPLIH
jgi:hypothetical protein